MDIETKYNMGLSSRFELKDGKIELSGGVPKVDDNVIVLMSFINWFRIYKQSYVINVYRFYQNSTNNLFRYKNILRLSILDIGTNHVPFAKFTAVDIPIDYMDRRTANLMISFTYNLISVQQENTIKKIII